LRSSEKEQGQRKSISKVLGVFQQSPRIKHSEELDIKLVEVEALLLKKEPIFDS